MANRILTAQMITNDILNMLHENMVMGTGYWKMASNTKPTVELSPRGQRLLAVLQEAAGHNRQQHGMPRMGKIGETINVRRPPHYHPAPIPAATIKIWPPITPMKFHNLAFSFAIPPLGQPDANAFFCAFIKT